MSQNSEIPEIENYRHPEKNPNRIFNSGDLTQKFGSQIFNLSSKFLKIFFVILNL